MKKNEKLNRAATNNQEENKKAELPKNQQQGGANALMVVKDESMPGTEPKAADVKPDTLTKDEVLAPVPLSIDDKLKHVEMLHRKAQQRLNLLARIKQLEAFEIAVSDEADELEPNIYQYCKLALFDDKGKQFTVQSAGLIKMVVDFIKGECSGKVTEIENEIIFPAA